MERLTKRMGGISYSLCDNVIIAKCENCNHRMPSCYDEDCQAELDVTTRLAAYEDTGLTPEEIPHWIPVSERLPDPKDMRHIQVLVIQKSTITGRPNIMSVARWNGADWVCRGVELARVTHWSYLPAAPKEENDA